jgi:hypothetical protein
MIDAEAMEAAHEMGKAFPVGRREVPNGDGKALRVDACPKAAEAKRSGPPGMMTRGTLRRVTGFSNGYSTGMAKLTSTQRERLPAKDFGLPERARTKAQKRETGNYPMPDRGHAISALRLAERQRELGNLTKDEFERIDRQARRKLRKKRPK